MSAAPFDAATLAEVATGAARQAWDQGMTVLAPQGTVVPIPLIAEPVVLHRAHLEALAREARTILSGAVKLARTFLGGSTGEREGLLAPFSGLERRAMERLFAAPQPAVVARVDFLPDDQPMPRALELNATIPAMQAYADLAAHSWIRAAAAARGMAPRQIEALQATCGSHMEALREALVAFYRSRGGNRERPSIALVARPGDAQSAEQRRLAEHFRQMGHQAANQVPADCRPEAQDLIYRHVWASRVAEDAPLAAALLAPERFFIANPVNGVLESKALFARLSASAEDGALADRAGLDQGERAAAARLPWTRLVEPGLVPRLVAERQRLVLKRSWDYGGKSVLLGAETAADVWEAAVRSAANEGGGGMVAQERIFAKRQPGTRVASDGVTRAELYRDISTFAGLGPHAPGGSVVRAAASPIVNILGGGGLAPVVPEDVWQALQ
jgi:hypothetical protein